VEAQGPQWSQLRLVVRGALGEAVLKGRLKGGAVGIVRGGEALLFDKLPQALNEIAIGGIGREGQQFEAPGPGQSLPEQTTLIAGLV
jgi:hypothetical protein